MDKFYLIYIPIEEKSSANFKIEHLRSYLERLSTYFKTVYTNTSIVLLINYNSEDKSQDVWKDINSLLENHDLKAGVSFRFSDLKRLNKYYQQGKLSFNIGSSLDKKSFMYYYDDYYHFYILDILGNEK
ncbi:MAG: hypothetical protein H0S78_04940 [Tissierellales bacterium]|nr:hypothetical protein [Tissierellales bacterium]